MWMDSCAWAVLCVYPVLCLTPVVSCSCKKVFVIVCFNFTVKSIIANSLWIQSISNQSSNPSNQMTFVTFRKQHVWTNSEMLANGPFPTMERERKGINNRKVKHSLVDVQGYEVIEVDTVYVQYQSKVWTNLFIQGFLYFDCFLHCTILVKTSTLWNNTWKIM